MPELKKYEYNTDYNCPSCNSRILQNGKEFYCSNQNCTFNKTSEQLFDFYAKKKQLKEQKNERGDKNSSSKHEINSWLY